jgi:hypothetical protein
MEGEYRLYESAGKRLCGRRSYRGGVTHLTVRIAN